MTSVPLKVNANGNEFEMRLVGGLLAVTQDHETLTIEPECGWVVIYESPIDPLSEQRQRLRRLRD